MLELSQQECLELQNRTMDKLCENLDDSAMNRLVKAIYQSAIVATIATIKEYELMQQHR